MKQRVTKNSWGVSVSLIFGVLATAVVIARDMSGQVDLFNTSSVIDTSLNGVSLDKVSFDKQSNNVDLDVHDALKDTLPILLRGDLSPANAAYPITRSGIYKLTTAKIASGVPNISITANNVTLDLGGNTLTGGTNGIEVTGNNVTVKNGTITGMSQNGLLVQGSGCHVENCDVVASVIGISLQSSSECVVENCRVRNMTQTGVSLQSTWTSSVRGCEISGIHGVGSVYGVLVQNGGNNTLEKCTVRDLQTNSLTVGDAVGGIVLDNEIASQAHDNQIGAVVSLTTTAQVYGVLTRATFNGTAKLPGQPTVAGVNPQVEIDSSGNALAVWEQGSPSQIYYSRSMTGLDWSLASTIPGQPSSAGANPQLAFDGSDNAFAVWSQGSPAQIYYSRFTAGLDWSLATTVPGQNPLNAGANPSIASNDSGVAVAVWTQGGNVYTARYSSGWSNAASLSGSETSPFLPKLAVDQSGNALAVWRAFDGSFINQIYYARYTVGSGVWSASVKFPGQPGNDGNGPQIAFDSSGNAIAVWYQNDGSNYQIYYARYTAVSGTWSNAAKISGQPGNFGSSPQVVFDSSDNALVVWFQSDGIRAQIYYARYTAGTSMWSNAAKIPGQILQNAYDPKVAVDSAGNAVVVWFQSNPAQIYFARYIAESSLWIGAEKILGQPSNNGFYPQVAVDTAGNATAVWYQFDGTRNQIYASYYSLGSGLIMGNGISGVTGYGAQGIGIMAPNRYVASNLCYDCDSGFAGVPIQFIDSQANARGVDNIDTNLTTPDTVSLIADQVSTIESKVDVLYQDSFTVESKLDYLTACDYDPLSAPTTLSTDYAAYCLSADMSGDLSITGSGIILSLNGHTISGGTNGILVSGDEVVIKNGTVRNASASGIKITGDKCTLQDITAVGNVTGFEFNGADNCTVSACRAIDNTREGFLLTNAQKNNFEQCEAITTSGAGLVAGIKTTGGTGNNFVDCTVNGVTSSAGEAYGLLASNEQKTNISSCAVNSVSGQNYTAGVALIGDYLGTPTAHDFTYVGQQNSRFPEWLNTPVGTYLAINDDSSPYYTRIFQFSPTDGLLSVTTTQNMAARCRQATWLSWHNKQYLAMVGANGGSDDAFIYEFNLATNTLTTITSYNYTGSVTLHGCDWLVSGTLAYLAYVAYPVSSTEELGVLRFDGSTLTKVSSLEYLNTGLLSVKHHLYNGNIRLVVTQHPPEGRPDIIVHSFNEPQGSEALTTSTLGLVSYDLTGAEYIEKCAWFDFDGQTYLAFGIVGATTTSNVQVLRYTENPTPTLSAFASFNYGGQVQDVDAVVTGTTVYLAVGGGIAGQMTKILTFDPYAATADRIKSYYNCSADSAITFGVSWNRCPAKDNEIFLGVSKAVNPRVYGFALNNQSQLNLVNDTIISDVKSTSNGSGLLADTVINSVTDNRAYNCHDGFVEGIRTQYPGASFDTNNWHLPG